MGNMATAITSRSSVGVAEADMEADCQREYQVLMDPYYGSVKSVRQLEKSHMLVKKQILTNLEKKVFESASNRREFMTRVSQYIDNTFAELKEHFEVKKRRDQNILEAQVAQTKAVKFYEKEMDKFIQNNTHATPKEVQDHHNKILDAVNKIAKPLGISVPPTIACEMKVEIEKRKAIYFEAAEINNLSLSDPAIGIDLGTTMCCLAVFYKGKIEIIPNRAQGSTNTTPSYVAYHQNGKDTFGVVAKEEAYMNPESTIYDAKRMIGRPWTDQMLQNDIKHWQFDVVNDLGNPKVITWGRTRYPHEVSAKLLHSFRLMADDYLGQPRGTVKKAVITVPAYFTEPQRRATCEAAKCAGLDVLNILSEPTAAAIAFNWHKRDEGERNVLIYDLGGGTFDVSIAKVNGDNINVLAVDGDTHLGGHDFDQLLMDYCVKEFLRTEKINLEEGKNSPQKFYRDDVRSALGRLRLQCEKVKERLSSCEQSKVEVPRICGRKHLVIQITRETLNEMVKPLIKKTLEITANALNNVIKSGIKSKDDIDDILLVGGSTRIPIVMEMLKQFFNEKQLSQYINPDEAVAYGAAIQAAILNNTKGLRNISVSDVTPMSLGIEVIGKQFSRIIEQNSKIPCTHKEIYTTSVNRQTKADITIYQGEEETSTANKWLGKFILEGLLPKPAGQEKAQVTMTINEMGILLVEAVSLSTGTNNAVTITSDRLAMDKQTIERLREQFQAEE